MAGLAFDIGRVAFIESQWDEDACRTIGWLLTKGWRLYGDVFSHHMPADYVPAWALASLFGPRLEAARAFMILAWALACAGVRYACSGPQPPGAAAVPYLFAVLSSQWLTYWMGHMMLIEPLWGYAAAVLLALLGGPIGLTGARGRPGPAALAGVLLAGLLSSSLTCALPFLCLAAWMLRDPDWRRAWRPLGAGFFGYWGIFGLWCLRHVDAAGWLAQAVRFNADVYPAFNGLKDGSPYWGFLAKAFKDNAAYFFAGSYGSTLERYFEGLLRAAVLGWAAWCAARRRFFAAAWWVLFTVAVKARAERMPAAIPFHSAPFYTAVTLLLSAELGRIWGFLRGRGDPRLASAAALVAALALSPTLIVTSMAASSLKEFVRPNPAYDAAVSALRRCTGPEDRLAVFPFYPRFYLDSGRLPGVPNVFYLPWQEAWEPQRSATAAALRRRLPKAVVVQDAAIWGIPWSEYGRGLQAEVEKGYVSAGSGPEAGEGRGFRIYVRDGEAEAFVGCARGG